jgi:hypothetical protein
MAPPVLSPGELSVRSDASGGEVLPQIEGSLGAYGSQIVFLFHGYNDSFAVASASYAAFLQNFPATANPLTDKWKPAIHKCFWPGDKSWGPVSFASYALELQPAKDSAKTFAYFLESLPAPGGVLDIYFIAHSLGNRVVLELLNALQNAKAAIQFKGFCMMAAATPVALVESNGYLFRASKLSSTRRTLFSEADTVLHFAFPLGETAALEGFFPTAIGRFGQPQSNWTAEAEMFTTAGPGYKHGDYWSDANTIPQISAFFGIPTASAQTSSSIVQHTLPAPASIAENQIPARALPASRTFG